MQAVLLVALATIFALCNGLTVVDDKEWEEYKAEHKKTYESKAIEEIRKKIYTINKDYIEKHNRRYERNEASYYMGINQFSDMLAIEVTQKMNGYRPGNSYAVTVHEIFDASGVELPKTVDWREKHVVTHVKNQGECGGCWAFSATGSLEGQHALKTKRLVSLSEQNLIDCSKAEGNDGCDGGLMDDAFKYVKKNKGLDTEKSYPFVGKDETCRFKRHDVGAKLKSWVNIKEGSEKALQEAVAKKGPVSVAIDASAESFTYYSGGVYDSTECCNETSCLDHGVLVVGYGVYNGTDYWLVKNSWGTSWGIKGYIMMSRNKDNQCGISTCASYPVV